MRTRHRIDHNNVMLHDECIGFVITDAHVMNVSQQSAIQCHKLKPTRIKVKHCHFDLLQRSWAYVCTMRCTVVACIKYDMSSVLNEIEQLINYLEPNLLNNVEFAQHLIM